MKAQLSELLFHACGTGFEFLDAKGNQVQLSQLLQLFKMGMILVSYFSCSPYQSSKIFNTI